MKLLNLGCGSTWKEHYPQYEGLDLVDHGQKYVGDVLKLLDPDKNVFPPTELLDNTVDEVMANHFLEHFNQDELKTIFLNVHRILVVGGTFRIVVPHKDRAEAWYLVHKTFFNEATFEMFNRVETDSYSEFGKWKCEQVVTNSRGNIHAVLKKLA